MSKSCVAQQCTSSCHDCAWAYVCCSVRQRAHSAAAIRSRMTLEMPVVGKVGLFVPNTRQGDKRGTLPPETPRIRAPKHTCFTSIRRAAAATAISGSRETYRGTFLLCSPLGERGRTVESSPSHDANGTKYIGPSVQHRSRRRSDRGGGKVRCQLRR